MENKKTPKKKVNIKKLLIWFGLVVWVFITVILFYSNYSCDVSNAELWNDYMDTFSVGDGKSVGLPVDIEDEDTVSTNTPCDNERLLYIGNDIIPAISFEKNQYLYGEFWDLSDDIADECSVNPSVLTIKSTSEPSYYMVMISRDDAKTDEQKEWFNETVEIIENKDIDTELLNSGYLPAFKNYCYGDATYGVVKEIEDISYPNTDTVFGVFSIGGYQDGPFVNSINEFDYVLTVYAIKGDTLMQLDYNGNTRDDFGIESGSLFSNCVNEVDNTVYNIDCIADKFSTLDVDNSIDFLLNRMLRTFSIK